MDMKIQNDEWDSVYETVVNVRHISSEELENLGMDELAFVKPVMTETGPAFSIHAADGRQLALTSSEALAAAMIIQNEMLPKLVH
jgi:hypothetical protein